MQPVFIAVSTPCHVARGLAGHPRCVRVGKGYSKTRLYSPIRSKATIFPRCARHHSVQRGCSSHILIAPLWRNQPWVSELFQLLKAAQWLIPLRRYLLSQVNGTIQPTARVMGPACVAAQLEPFVLPERVLNTMAEARASSTRSLYALNWSIFSACG